MIGIFGLPQSGKTTLFQLLTSGQKGTVSQEGPVTLTTAVVPLPDPRLDALHRLTGSRRVVPATITLVDIAAGPGSRQERPLGPLRNVLGRMDVLVHVVRAFTHPQAPHPLGDVNPQRDIDALEQELLLYDLDTVERRLERLQEEWQKGARPKDEIEKEQALFRRLQEALQAEQPLRVLDLSPDDRRWLQGFTLLTLKPLLVVVNTDEDGAGVEDFPPGARGLAVPLALEWELAQLPPEEAATFREAYDLPPSPARERLLQALRQTMDVITFYTFNEKETRAWLLPRGHTAVQAAGRIHSDMARGFIRAEVTPVEVFLEVKGNRAELRARGFPRLEGREYVVQDGDILQIRFQRRT